MAPERVGVCEADAKWSIPERHGIEQLEDVISRRRCICRVLARILLVKVFLARLSDLVARKTLNSVSLWKISQKNDLRKQLQNHPRTSRGRSGPLSTRRNTLVSQETPSSALTSLKQTSENPENPP